jgi:anaerobic carbon-monoxide dehydrogenase iron sulfur subunit
MSVNKMDTEATVKVLKFHPEKCVGCLICEKACSKVQFKTEDGGDKSAIRIIKNNGSFEMIACDQRGLCIDMCPVGALYRNKKGVILLDAKICIGCQACVAFCPINAMRKAPIRVEPFKCISCGACVRACPEHALELVEEQIDDIREIVYHKQGA